MSSFHPRRTDSHHVRVVGGRRLKLYAISADDDPTSPELLVHSWQGDMLWQRLLRADDGTRFVPVEPHLFACGRELHVIDHERRARAHDGFGTTPGGIAGYVADTLTVTEGTALPVD